MGRDVRSIDASEIDFERPVGRGTWNIDPSRPIDRLQRRQGRLFALRGVEGQQDLKCFVRAGAAEPAHRHPP